MLATPKTAPNSPWYRPRSRGGDDVADDRLGADDQAAAAESLDGAEHDELGHGLAESGEDRSDQEDDDRGLEEHLPAVLVAELAPQRCRDGRGEQVGGDDPREMGPPLRSPTIVGSAVETIVWSRAASSMPEHQRADDETAALHGERGDPVEDFLGRDERLGHEMSIAFCGYRLIEHRTGGRSRRAGRSAKADISRGYRGARRDQRAGTLQEGGSGRPPVLLPECARTRELPCRSSST